VFDLFSSRRAEGARWTLDLPERMPAMLADPLRLRQILVNLLSNAERHAGGAGVTVSARVEPPDLVVRVEDEGPGIPPERLRHLFEPFLSQGSGGVGLGLSIASRIIEDHGGRLELESKKNAGATFIITLPLGKDESWATS
jgi:signal transduction histidine kinase